MVYKVVMDSARNRARGVLYIDRITREPKEVNARAVVLCAQAQESVRILLNSANGQYPNGLANSSGVLGHYLMDHITGGGANGEFLELAGKPSMSEPQRPTGMYIARFRNLPGGPKSKDFLRGYGYEGGGGTNFNWGAGGFGKAYKEALLEGKCYLGIGGFGECLARKENYVELDPEMKDTFGIPVLRIHMTYGENEQNMVKDMADSAPRCWRPPGRRTFARMRTPRHRAGPFTRLGSRVWAMIRRSPC